MCHQHFVFEVPIPDFNVPYPTLLPANALVEAEDGPSHQAPAACAEGPYTDSGSCFQHGLVLAS